MERLFKFDGEFLEYEIAIPEDKFYPRLLEKHQELVSQPELSPRERVEEFLHLLILVHIPFRFDCIY